MPRGGRRPGAGRPAGAATKKTRAIADKAAEQGITPLEVMLDTMRDLVAYAHKLNAKTQSELRLDRMMQACAIAKDCAPYIHPRMPQMVTGPNGGPLQTEDVTERGDPVDAARRILLLLNEGARSAKPKPKAKARK